MRDIAAQVGVSTATVSRALANDPLISQETSRRVRATALQMGYVPNRLASGLRLQRSHMLAMISDEIATTPFAAQIVLGAQETASARGWMLMLFNTADDPQTEERDVQAILSQRVDGVLYACMYHRYVRVPDALRTLPIVLVDARTDGNGPPAVIPDEERGGREATEELLRHGHRRIGFPLSHHDVPARYGRLAGYRAALAAAGIPFDPQLVVTEATEPEGGYRASRQLLTLPDRPTALFCFNDRMAMGAYRAAAELRLRIPQDLSVIGFDNQPYIAEGLYPGLTTMQLPHYEMGVWAVERLLALIESPDEPHPCVAPKLLACPLVRRGSVGPPSGTPSVI